MKSRILKSALVGITLTLASISAHAVTISSITLEVVGSTYQVQGTDTVADLLNEFNSGTDLGCSVSLAAVDEVGGVQTCGAAYPQMDIATLIEVVWDTTTSLAWEFGPDWGFGGIIYATSSGGTPGDLGQTIDSPYTADYWWNLNWNTAGEVIGFNTGSEFGVVTLSLLGFEHCCGGAMSLRYSEDSGETWQIAAVPEPSTLALLGLGLLGMGLVSRRKA